jgi:hypothetical protein
MGYLKEQKEVTWDISAAKWCKEPWYPTQGQRPCKGESRDKLGECLKKTTVRCQDQWRMLQVITHSFPSNYCRHKIIKAKESDKCDLYKDLQIAEGMFTTDDNLLPQTLGHIQYECEALSEIHTLAHHRCCRLLHTELARLTSSEWCFICINGEKNLAEIGDEFPEIFNLSSRCGSDSREYSQRPRNETSHDIARRGEM